MTASSHSRKQFVSRGQEGNTTKKTQTSKSCVNSFKSVYKETLYFFFICEQQNSLFCVAVCTKASLEKDKVFIIIAANNLSVTAFLKVNIVLLNPSQLDLECGMRKKYCCRRMLDIPKEEETHLKPKTGVVSPLLKRHFIGISRRRSCFLLSKKG